MKSTDDLISQALEGAFELPLQDAKPYVARALREIDLTRVEGKSYDELREMTRRSEWLLTGETCWRSFRLGAALGAALAFGVGLTWALLDRLLT